MYVYIIYMCKIHIHICLMFAFSTSVQSVKQSSNDSASRMPFLFRDFYHSVKITTSNDIFILRSQHKNGFEPTIFTID